MAAQRGHCVKLVSLKKRFPLCSTVNPFFFSPRREDGEREREGGRMDTGREIIIIIKLPQPTTGDNNVE